MATNLAIDDKLLKAAQVIAGMRTKKDTVNLALKEFIQRHEQKKIIGIFGTMDFDEDYDYKAMRR